MCCPQGHGVESAGFPSPTSGWGRRVKFYPWEFFPKTKKPWNCSQPGASWLETTPRSPQAAERAGGSGKKIKENGKITCLREKNPVGIRSRNYLNLGLKQHSGLWEL